ncbi:LysR family transcriptional regulator [Kribbella qitaiheensis]|uniref:LysR family transcriptional regulator n=1 Tax=Kribbella qitaiheensis TaxID=1544730 RepID=A0A7G6X656_9ACTN|nr:LysR family transcriptional regulator [Kribbella qitaiheensis]QNE21721.1 LysR family transcriptional regulator [Kribbella qitaiheensis]
MALPAVSPRQLEYLVAIAETGGITAAAARCHVSQSAVSLAVAELERALQVRLVLRGSRRGTRLTPAGAQVVTDARKVLGALSELAAGARSLGQDLDGGLTVGCYAPIAPFHLPAAIAGFRQAQPQVEIQFTEGTLPEVQRDLLDGRCELAFLYLQNLQPGIEYAVLHDRPPAVLLPPDHRLARRRSVALAELASEPLVLLDVAPSEHYFRAVFEAAGLEMRPAYRAGSVELARALVARGIGYSLAVQRPRVDLSYEGLPLVTRPLKDVVPTTPVVLGWAAGGRLTRRGEAFLKFCRKTF